MRIVAILALAGCVSRTIAIAPSELARNAEDLARDRRAVVTALDGQETVIRADERVSVYLRDGDVQRPVTLTVGELVAGCDRDFSAPGCAALRVSETKLTFRRERAFDSDVIAKAVGFAAIAGLVGYCAAECQDESTVPRAFGYTALAVGGAFLLVVGAMMLGGG